MVKPVYSIRDRKTECYMSLFVCDNDKVAQAQVTMSLRAESIVSEFPEDYTLYRLGSFNDSTGELVSDVHVVAEIVNLVMKDSGGNNANS